MSEQLKIGSLCSGYLDGGLDLAVEEFFGAETAWFAEYDAAPSKVLAHHWPDVPNYGDMTTIDWQSVPKVDIVAGGTPCQDLSAAGRRKGMTEGTRSNLWVQMRECIAAVRPSVVVWENVRGSFSAYAKSGVEDEGSHEPCVCCGPDRRGGLHSPRGGQEALLQPASVGGDDGAGDQAGSRTPMGAAGRVDGGSSSGVPRPGGADARTEPEGSGCACPECGGCVDASDCEMELEQGLLGEPYGPSRPALRALGRVLGDLSDLGYDTEWVGLRAADAGAPHGRFRVFVVAYADSAGRGSLGRVDTIRRDADGRGRADGPRTAGEPAAPAPVTSDPTEGRPGEPDDAVRFASSEASLGGGPGEACSCGSISWGPYRPAIHRWELTLGRAAPSPTLADGKGGALRLSPIFVEFMMGLPIGHVTSSDIGLTRNEQLKALGNGVVPQQALLALSIAWGRLADVRQAVAA